MILFGCYGASKVFSQFCRFFPNCFVNFGGFLMFFFFFNNGVSKVFPQGFCKLQAFFLNNNFGPYYLAPFGGIFFS